MNHDLTDFMSELRNAKTTEQAGQSFVTFAQRTGANVVHTFFGACADKLSVSTLPSAFAREEIQAPANREEHAVKAIRTGVPRVFWGVDLDLDNQHSNEEGRAGSRLRIDNFRQRSSVTFSMPNADQTYSGAGIGLGYDETGKQFLKRMEESGGAFAVAAFAAYAQMLKSLPLENVPSRLSPRQTEILQLLASGHRLADIADKLKISDSAVNLYLSKLRMKLGVRTKEEALAKAITSGWIKL